MDTAATSIYTLSLHDALPISVEVGGKVALISRKGATLALATMAHVGVAQRDAAVGRDALADLRLAAPGRLRRSEEHTSELQSHSDLVCRLLLEKKKKYHTSAA